MDRKIIATVQFLWMLVVLCDANNQTGNNLESSGSSTKSSLKANLLNENHQVGSESEISNEQNSRFSENYKNLLSASAHDIDILNDSSEMIDDDKFNRDLKNDSGLRFDDFVSPNELAKSLGEPTGSGGIENTFVNVFKVPKSKTKKTLSTRQSSIKNEPFINDFNGEPLYSATIGNLSFYDTYFHAFTQLFDHNKWNAKALSLGDVGKSCLRDVQIYLDALTVSRDWAVKVSDACGRYRGQYFFDNQFWLGSKQFCYDIDAENHHFRRNDSLNIPRLKFFVTKMIVKLEPVTHKVCSVLTFSYARMSLSMSIFNYYFFEIRN
jgi:Nose resistant-to-fluoxetine protein, N-terminal domain